MRHVSAVLLVVCAVVGLNVSQAQDLGGSPEGKKMKNPVASSPATITAGQQAYQKRCAFCHGKDGTGNGPMAPKGTTPSNLVDAMWDRGATDGEIFLVIRDGAGPKFDMKGLKGKLTDQELWSVVNYVRSLGPSGKSH